MADIIPFPLSEHGVYVLATSHDAAGEIAVKLLARRLPSMGNDYPDAAKLWALQPLPMQYQLGLYWTTVRGPWESPSRVASKLLIPPLGAVS